MPENGASDAFFASFMIENLLYSYGKSEIDATWKCRPIDVSGVTVYSTVKVVLIGIEYVAYPG